MMDAALKKRWIEALRSGKFKQAKGTIIDLTPFGEGKGRRYCCLGVLDRVMRPSVRSHLVKYPPYTLLSRPTQIELAGLNDKGSSFLTIADWIEENL